MQFKPLCKIFSILMNRSKKYTGLLSIILGAIMILSQINSIYFMDYFAGDCIPVMFRFGLILFYSILIFAGYFLLRNKGVSRYLYLISGIGLIVDSIIVFLTDFDCGLSFIFYKHLLLGLVIAIFPLKNKKLRIKLN